MSAGKDPLGLDQYIKAGKTTASNSHDPLGLDAYLKKKDGTEPSGAMSEETSPESVSGGPSILATEPSVFQADTELTRFLKPEANRIPIAPPTNSVEKTIPYTPEEEAKKQELRTKKLQESDKIEAAKHSTVATSEYLPLLGEQMGKGFLKLMSAVDTAPELLSNAVMMFGANAVESLTHTKVDESKLLFDVETPLSQAVDKVTADMKAMEEKFADTPSGYFSKGDYALGFQAIGAYMAEALPASVAVAATGGVAGIPAAVGAGTAVFGAQEYAELRNNPNLTKEEKTVVSLTLGFIESSFNLVNTIPVGKAFSAIIAKAGTKEGGKIIKTGLYQQFQNLFVKYPLLAVPADGLEEFATEVSQNAVKKYSGANPDLDLMDGAMDAFYTGVGMGASFGGGLIGLKKASGLRTNLATKEAIDPEDIPTVMEMAQDINKATAFTKSVETLEADGEITTEQKRAIITQFGEHLAVARTIKGRLSDEQVNEIYPLLLKKKALQKEIEGADPTLTEGVQAEIDDIDGQLKAIARPPVRVETFSDDPNGVSTKERTEEVEKRIEEKMGEGDDVVKVRAKPKAINEQSIVESQKWIKDLYSLPNFTRIQDKNGDTYDIKDGKIRKLTLDNNGDVVDTETIHTNRGGYFDPDFFKEGYTVLKEQSTTATDGGGQDATTQEQEHANNITTKFKEQFKAKGVPDEQIEGAITLMNLRAKSWASEENGRTPEQWFAKIADVKSGEFQDQTPRQYQLPDGTKVMGMHQPEVTNGFYSPLEKVIGESKSDKLPAKQWVEKFAKGEEAKWTGLNDWLAQQQGAVSKADIQQYLKDNRVEVVEVVKSDAMNASMFKAEMTASGNWDVYHNNQLVRTVDASEAASRADAIELVKDEADEDYRGDFGDTKFGQHQTEGEKENYKEVLVTMPYSKEVLSFEQVKKLSDEQIFEKYKAAKQWRFGEWTKEGVKENRSVINDEVFEQQSWDKGNEKFKSSHFDEPNILVHLRMNTRTDSEGKKVLFLEEIQSDWGQKGKKEGFINKEREDIVYFIAREIYNIRKSSDSSDIKKEKLSKSKEKAEKNKVSESDIQKAFEKYGDFTNNPVSLGGVEQAPFVTDTNQWTKLALKVALKEAVKQGAERIVWTTGEQQNDRYNLQNSIDRIEYSPNEDGTFQVNIFGLDENTTVYSKQNATLKEIEDTIGKDMAEKIQNDYGTKKEFFHSVTKKEGNNPIREIKGEGLKVGGKGMKGFYGSPTEGSLGIVGNVAKSLFKQEPRTVGISANERGKATKDFDRLIDSLQFEKQLSDNGRNTGIVSTVNEDGTYTIEWNETKPTNQHSIDITPELKAQAQEGQPLFQKDAKGKPKGAVETLADGRKVIHALDAPDFSTMVHELAHVFEGDLSESEQATVKEFGGSEPFARGFEKYLRDGKAPTPELKTLFDKFKQWLTDIYKTVKGSPIGKRITPEIKAIFDRLLTEKEPSIEAIAEEGTKADIIAFWDGLKLKNNRMQSSITFGIPEALWNTTVEIMKQSHIAGKTIVDAIADGIAHLKSSDYYKNLADSDIETFKNLLSGTTTDKVKASEPFKSLLARKQRALEEQVLNLVAPGVNVRDLYKLTADPTKYSAQEVLIEVEKAFTNDPSLSVDDILGSELAKTYGLTRGMLQGLHNAAATNRMVTLPDMTLLDRFMRGIADVYDPLNKLTALSVSKGIVAAGQRTFVQAHELKASVMQTKIDAMKEKMVFSKNKNKPAFMQRLVKAGVNTDRFDLWLYARHATERNTAIAFDMQTAYDEEISKGVKPTVQLMPDAGSGMSNQQAIEILAEAERNGETEAFEKFEKEFREVLIQGRVEILVEGGLISEESADGLLDGFENYVPLMVRPKYKNKAGNSAKKAALPGKDIYRAKGSDFYSFNDRVGPFSSAIYFYQQAVIRAEVNKANQELLALAKEFTEDTKRTGANYTNIIDIVEGEGRVAYDYEGNEIIRDKNSPKNVVPVFVDGVKTGVKLSDDLYRALQKTRMDQISQVVSLVPVLRTVNNYLRAVNTTLNPNFIGSNPLRDIEQSIFYAKSQNKEGLTRAYVKNLPKAVKMLTLHQRGTKTDPFVQRWLDAGGAISFFGSEGLIETEKDITDLYKKYKGGRGNLLKAGYSHLAETVTSINAIAESASRLSIFHAMLETGATETEAALASKDVTVNFERKGEWTSVVNLLYLFANAGVQGSFVGIKLLATSKTARAFGAAVIVGAYALAALNDLADGDDDEYEKVPQGIKDRNLMLWNGTKFSKIPIPYGVLGIFKRLGDDLYSLTKGSKTIGEVLEHQAVTILDTFNPSPSPNVEQLVMPTIGDVAVQMSTNINYFGGKIAPDKRGFEPEAPESTRYFKKTSPTFIKIFAKLNEMSGGTTKEKGWLDRSPAKAEYLVDQLFGGAGQSVKSIAAAATDVITGNAKEIKIERLPLVKVVMEKPAEERNLYLLYDKLNKADVKKLNEKEEKELLNLIEKLYESKEIDAKQRKRYKKAYFKQKKEQEKTREEELSD